MSDDAADALERQVFFDRFTARWSELRADDEVSAEIEAERETEGRSLHDRSR
jgi:hypothetical protein